MLSHVAVVHLLAVAVTQLNRSYTRASGRTQVGPRLFVSYISISIM